MFGKYMTSLYIGRYLMMARQLRAMTAVRKSTVTTYISHN